MVLDLRHPLAPREHRGNRGNRGTGGNKTFSENRPQMGLLHTTSWPVQDARWPFTDMDRPQGNKHARGSSPIWCSTTKLTYIREDVIEGASTAGEGQRGGKGAQGSNGGGYVKLRRVAGSGDKGDTHGRGASLCGIVERQALHHHTHTHTHTHAHPTTTTTTATATATATPFPPPPRRAYALGGVKADKEHMGTRVG